LGPHRKNIQLDRESFQRIVDWLDLNAQYHGDYSHNRQEGSPPAPEGEKALREYVRELFGPEWAGQPFAALVNLALPLESRILKAPLGVEGGGWGQVKGGWKDTSDPRYRKMAERVQACLASLPKDLAGTCGQGPGPDGKCRCGCCWVRVSQKEGKIAGTPSPEVSLSGK
jgi:hypothetical protein